MTTRQDRAPLIAKAFAITGWVATVADAVAAIVQRVVDPAPVLPNTFGFGDVALVGFEVMGVSFASVGGLLVIKRPSNAVGWFMVVIGAAYAVSGYTAAVTFSAVAHGGQDGRAAFAAWATVAMTVVGGLVFALPFIFPTGRSPSRRWDRLIRATMLPLVIIPLALLLQPGPLQLFPTIANPFGIAPDLRAIIGVSFTQIMTGGSSLLLPVVAVAFVSRYRLSGPVERQQLKWFLLASAGSVLGVAVAATGAMLSKDPPGEAGMAIFGFAGALVPVAIGIAILRYHLYDIDRVISRTLGYGAVTGVLGAVFAVAILSLQALLTTFTQGQTIAVAFSTLVVFALFQPVRRRVQRAVDRRFDRARYDADRTIDSLAGRLRGDLDLATVRAEIVAIADAAVRPASVSIWLRGSHR